MRSLVPIYAKKDGNRPPSANQVASKDEPRHSHAVCTLRVISFTGMSKLSQDSQCMSWLVTCQDNTGAMGGHCRQVPLYHNCGQAEFSSSGPMALQHISVVSMQHLVHTTPHVADRAE